MLTPLAYNADAQPALLLSFLIANGSPDHFADESASLPAFPSADNTMPLSHTVGAYNSSCAAAADSSQSRMGRKLSTTSLSGSSRGGVKSFKEAPTGVDTHKKPWSADEERMFEESLRVCGRGKWAAISRLMKTRSPRQVKNHAYTYFQRLSNAESKSKRNSFQLTNVEEVDNSVISSGSSPASMESVTMEISPGLDLANVQVDDKWMAGMQFVPTGQTKAMMVSDISDQQQQQQQQQKQNICQKPAIGTHHSYLSSLSTINSTSSTNLFGFDVDSLYKTIAFPEYPNPTPSQVAPGASFTFSHSVGEDQSCMLKLDLFSVYCELSSNSDFVQ
eukprot:ANDGO_08579.mRNA.1 Myb-like protein H